MENIRETKAEAFERLAPKRVDKVLGALDSLGGLATRNYEYTPEQVAAMFNAITVKLNEIQQKYNGVKEVKKNGFHF